MLKEMRQAVWIFLPGGGVPIYILNIMATDVLAMIKFGLRILTGGADCVSDENHCRITPHATKIVFCGNMLQGDREI